MRHRCRSRDPLLPRAGALRASAEGARSGADDAVDNGGDGIGWGVLARSCFPKRVWLAERYAQLRRGRLPFQRFFPTRPNLDLAATLPEIAAEIAAEMRARIALHAASVFNPDRGQDDGAACAAAFARHDGFYGPFLGLG
jgi:hypothetical protein